MGERIRFRSYSPEEIFAGLETTNILSEELEAAIYRQRDTILPTLRNAAANGPWRTALHASCLLLDLGESAGTYGLLTHVNGLDATARRVALHRLSCLRFDYREGGLQVPLDKDAVLASVKPLLLSREAGIPNVALSILERLQTPEADAEVMACIAASDPEMRASAARWLSYRGLDKGALDAAEDLLFGQHSVPPNKKDHLTYWLTQTLKDLCERGSPESQARACGLASRFVRQNLDRSDNKTGNHVWHCLKGIAVVAPSEEADLLKAVLKSQIEPAFRGIALNRLSKIEGHRCVMRLCHMLKDPVMRLYAAEGLAELAKQSKDQRIVDAIASAIETETSQAVVSEMAKALIASGGAARSLLRKATGRAAPNVQMSIHWNLKGLDPKQIVDQFIAADVTAPISPEQMAEYEAHWLGTRDALGLLIYIAHVGKSFVDIVSKTSDYPADHCETIERLCSATRGAFEVEDIHQIAEATEKYQVGFRYRGKPHTIEVNNFGRYLDLPSILNGLNDLLKKDRHNSRFFHIKGGEETALIIFASANEFPKVARRLHIALETDHDAPRREGIAYTNHVLHLVSSNDEN